MINDRDYEEEYELARRDINYGLITPDMDISPYSPKVQAFEIVDMFKKCLKVSDE